MVLNRQLLMVSGLWLLIMVVAVATRPLLPVDETRYLAVAWEMWQRGDFLVPYLNGEPYSHKPPLLFWIINLGWAIFGVNEWWPQLVAPLFGLASLFLTVRIAGQLWPEDAAVAQASPLILFGSVFWALFTTLIMFDMILAFCALLAVSGMLSAWRHGGKSGWWIMGLGIGIGALAKGPAILVHTIPVALLAPWWDVEKVWKGREGSWKGWYLGILGASGIGLVIGLAWAVPAALFGGAEYREAILWKQTAGRMVKSFAHRRPWYWFLAVIGPMLLPWTIWPPLWRALGGVRKYWRNAGVRLSIAWFGPVFVIFSAISGKQLHYLLPVFPAFALLIGYVLTRPGDWSRRWDHWIPALLFLLVGAAAIGISVIADQNLRPMKVWAYEVNGYWGALLIVVAIAVWKTGSGVGMRAMASLTGLIAAFVCVAHLMLAPHLASRFDLHPLSKQLHALQEQGYVIANYGKYHGQYQFLGRLEKSIGVIGDGEILDWLEKTPKGKVVTYHEKVDPNDLQPDFVVPFRGDLITVWDADTLRKDHTLAYRPH